MNRATRKHDDAALAGDVRIVRPREIAVTIAGAVAGLVLFVYAVDRVGTDAIVDGIRRAGPGLALVLAVAGARFVVRAQCWRLCMPPGPRLPLTHATGAFLAGDAVGNLTPLGLLASEPFKVLLTRRHLATVASVASLALENLLYTASVLAMIAFGLVLMLVAVPVPPALRWTAIGLLAGIGALAVAARAALAWREAARASRDAQAAAARRFAPIRDTMREAAEHPGLVLRVVSLEMTFHALAVAEVYLTLWWLLGDARPTIVQAILFETVNRLVTVLFKFIPFRIGIDEASSGAFATLLAISPATGVALAVIRKVRMLFWSAVGLALVATHRASRVR